MRRSCGATYKGCYEVTDNFRWRCGQGTHPYPSRTRRLRPGRPMVLCWRRHGRVGGCRNSPKNKMQRCDINDIQSPSSSHKPSEAECFPWGCSSVGRAPALQAGGHEFESHHLHSTEESVGQQQARLAEHIENFTLNK